MTRSWISLVAVPVLHFALANPAFADAAAEKYIDDALPLMYHTCKTVVDEAAGDSAYITKVVRALVAVTVYNHEIDISKHVKSEAAGPPRCCRVPEPGSLLHIRANTSVEPELFRDRFRWHVQNRR